MENKKILIIDDERSIRQMLQECLEMEGYQVLLAANGSEALKLAAMQPDLMLLDVNMPDIDGYVVCEKLRAYVSCPIIFLTARTQEQDRVKGLKSGGDDYILKPFGIDELLARVEAHLRREERRNLSQVAAEVRTDPSGRRLLYGNADMGLTRTEYNIVELLADNHGRTFDKEQIYERVRGLEGAGDSNIITEHVRRIRKKMEQFTSQEYIVTVWGVGYRWNG